jgi:uncharacterized protein (DUF1697 family)
MASVVFLRAVNVGTTNRCRPADLAKQLARFDIVNIGAVGTFVVRKKISDSFLRNAIGKQLPFKCEMMIVPARDLLRLAAKELFAAHAADANITRFVMILAKRVRAKPAELHQPPNAEPQASDWAVKVLAVENQFVLGLYRREMKAVSYLAKLEKQLGVPVTTRNWNTIEKVVKVLERECFNQSKRKENKRSGQI